MISKLKLVSELSSEAQIESESMSQESKLQIPDRELAVTRRRQIFLAVTRVLARKPFHQASVKEIAAEAGIAAGSIYVYLKSKDEMLLLIAESMVAELAEELPEIREEAGHDPRLELLGAMRAALDVIDRYREAFAVLNHEVRYLERNPHYRQAIKQAVRPYKEALAGPLEAGREHGLINLRASRARSRSCICCCRDGQWAATSWRIPINSPIGERLGNCRGAPVRAGYAGPRDMITKR